MEKVFRLVISRWRIYKDEEQTTQFNISAVSIEENGGRQPINYVLPQHYRQQNTQFIGNQVNEQSLVLDVCGLKDGDLKPFIET